MTDSTATLKLIAQARSFLLAGDAIFTLVSRRSGERKTFRVQKKQPRNTADQPGWFVKLLTGPNNIEDYTYLCFLHTPASVIPGEAPALAVRQNKHNWGAEAFTAFRWLVGVINAHDQQRFAEQCEFWHLGRCARCGRALTDPESIACGLGPTCREKAY